MVGKPKRGLHCAHVCFHTSNDHLLTADRFEMVNCARLFGTAEMRLRQRLARPRQLDDLAHRMPDAVCTVLGHPNGKLEQPRRSHQRRASGNNLLARVDPRRQLRLDVDYKKKGLLRAQAHRTP